MEYNNSHVLIAVLDWGWGHAHRCLPIVEACLEKGYRLTLASGRDVIQRLHSIFPEIETLELPTYQGQYRWNNMAMNIAMKSPALIQALEAEQDILRKQHQRTPFDAVISDGRYGCFLEDCPSFFLTHQVHLKGRKKLTDTMANKVHRQWMDNFDEVWVPDFAFPPGLGGQLSHEPEQHNCQFIGPLSRFSNALSQEREMTTDWLFFADGPEPACTELKQQLFELAEKQPHLQFVFITSEARDEHEEVPDHILNVTQPEDEALERLVSKSKHILCRSDFFHLSNLSVWQRTACLIPTPGYPEQLYLADFYAQKYLWPVCMQSEFKSLKQMEDLPTPKPLPFSKDSNNLELLFERLRHFQI